MTPDPSHDIEAEYQRELHARRHLRPFDRILAAYYCLRDRHGEASYQAERSWRPVQAWADRCGVE